ncbi:NACHT domain-containing protein [Streptomyces sp. NPDC060334]|uniref:NACHT domain-containing protein n=1 Tax=Streptomyces sp. NPDC060334 TaxID=3347099 RepID=UPI0036526214
MEESPGARALYDELRALENRARTARIRSGEQYSRRDVAKQAKGDPKTLGNLLNKWLSDDWDTATTPAPNSETHLLNVIEVWCTWSGEEFTGDTRRSWATLLDEAQPRRARAQSDRTRALASTGAGTDPFDQVIRDLAGLVRDELRDELDGLQVYRPYPLPVCGRAAPKDDVLGMYRRTPAGRLVILGESGSGKSVLALRLARELIDNHTAGAPVPVVFALRTWNEPTTGWRQWLAGTLAERYPQLRGQRNGHITLARELVNHDRILPVLDGLDELPPKLRAAALRQLPSDGPVIVTSTTEGYTAAVEAAGPVPGATEITLSEIDNRELARYLPQSSAADWTSVVEPPDSRNPAATAVREALRTPLMITLAREVHRANPSQLLEVAADGGCAAVERSLLNEFIPAVYSEALREPQRKRRRSSREWHIKDEEDRETTLRYVRALAKLAADDRSGGILAWWRLYATVPRGFRALAIGAFYLFAGLVAAALAQGAYSWTGGSDINVLLLSLPAVAAGAVFRAVQALRDETLPAPVYVRLRFRGRFAKVCMKSVAVLLIAKSSLLPVKAAANATGLGDVLMLAVVISWGLGLAIAGTYMLRQFLEAPLKLDAVPSTPATLAAARHSLFLVSAIALVSTALGLGGAAVAAFHYAQWALMVVAFAAPARVATAVLSTAYGRFCFVTRPYFALTGRLPWPMVDFLDDAACRGVLRQVGPVYVFHHDLLIRALLDGSSSSRQDAIGREDDLGDDLGDGRAPGAGVRKGGTEEPSAT